MTEKNEIGRSVSIETQRAHNPFGELASSLVNLSEALIRAEFAVARQSTRAKELEMEPATGIEPATL
jgi:hypothetical protein